MLPRFDNPELRIVEDRLLFSDSVLKPLGISAI